MEGLTAHHHHACDPQQNPVLNNNPYVVNLMESLSASWRPLVLVILSPTNKLSIKARENPRRDFPWTEGM